jgi:hypothetical protein
VREHKLKTTPAAFYAIRYKRKLFEFRKNDRGFEEGDVLVLQEYDAAAQYYTGQQERVRVTYIITGPDFGIPVGYACMSIRLCTDEEQEQNRKLDKYEFKARRR